VGQETHATAGQEAGATNPLTHLVSNAGLAAFAHFVHVLDRRLVDQRLCPPPHLERMAIVPLDASLNVFPIFKHNHHRRVRLDLLLQIENLGLTVHCFIEGTRRGSVEGGRSRLLISLGSPTRVVLKNGERGETCHFSAI